MKKAKTSFDDEERLAAEDAEDREHWRRYEESERHDRNNRLPMVAMREWAKERGVRPMNQFDPCLNA